MANERGASLILRDFRREDQDAVKALVLDGLKGRWGTLKPGLNPDLDDIAVTYTDGHFLVGESENLIVACGALIPRSDHTFEIVRMSVDLSCRRQGLGTRVLHALVQRARSAGSQRLILETTRGWDDAVAFYERYGFIYTHLIDDEFGGQLHFALEMN